MGCADGGTEDCRMVEDISETGRYCSVYESADSGFYEQRMKAVLFDLDGTLLNTSFGVISSVKYMINRLGYAMPDERTLKTFIGPPIKKRVIEIYGVSDEEGMDAMNLFRAHYGQKDIYLAEHYNGMPELLKRLKEKGYKLGVATYKREDQGISLLERYGLALYFDIIHGADAEGKRSKADVVRLCIQDLQVEPEQVVMIGDSDNDAIGAEQAGTKFIGVTYGFGFHSREEISAYANIGIADTCMEIFEIIEKHEK
jgi:phosphoglycolate phosphatase